ncbi:hypothetical protein M413DRAFT_448001 [Hebeloma cylindrosporum]|uniref:Uncharacterized protein n=1 Tax=Hebeloma cylindrosporum TaxID=76867 RepID=A0A0C2XKI3_HEBCY|nr:hypothetical protein M413DRAFT_448001 [Hebeloma cylindrosporum h7]
MPERYNHCDSNAKVLRPERCVALNGHPCVACIEDIELEKEMNQGEGSIDSKIQKRRALRTTMNENHDRLIHRFPPEIAFEIFIQYGASFDKRGDSRSHPLYLGAVCQKWRQLAWATPELWTSLHIASSPLQVNESLPQLVAQWLERSAALPLTIDFEFIVCHLVQHPADKIYPEVINHLNHHSERWREVHLKLPARHLNRLCGSFQGNILRTLVLSGIYDEPSNTSGLAFFGMKSKPSPTHLTLDSFRLISVDIAWNFITVASLKTIPVDECFEFLRRCPVLESLTLTSVYFYRAGVTFPMPQTRISCLHLHSLELSMIDESVLSNILDSICLPALRRWVHFHCPVPWDKMLSLAKHSSLKEFRMSGGPDAYPDVPNFLHQLSSLEVLQLRFWFSSRKPPASELLDRLCTPASGSSPFLPHLQYLEFALSFPLSWESIPQLFASPNRQSLKIKVDYESHRGPQNLTDEAAERLLEMVGKGYDLTILRNGQDLIQELREKLRRT